MTELLQYSFMQKALLASLFTIIICAISGALSIINRNVFIAGGVSHASYGGIGLAIWFGLPPLLGAVGIAAIIGTVIGIIRQKHADKIDAVVSAFWAVGMAIGILVNDLKPGYSTDFLNYLFGNILLVSTQELIFIGLFSLISVILIIKYYRTVLVCSADKDYASTLGLPVHRINLIVFVLLCVSVVLMMKVSGLILVMALLAMPASIAETRTKKLSSMIILSGLIAGFSIITGLTLSIQYNLTPSAIIVIILSIIYIINLILTWKK